MSQSVSWDDDITNMMGKIIQMFQTTNQSIQIYNDVNRMLRLEVAMKLVPPMKPTKCFILLCVFFLEDMTANSCTCGLESPTESPAKPRFSQQLKRKPSTIGLFFHAICGPLLGYMPAATLEGEFTSLALILFLG